MIGVWLATGATMDGHTLTSYLISTLWRWGASRTFVGLESRSGMLKTLKRPWVSEGLWSQFGVQRGRLWGVPCWDALTVPIAAVECLVMSSYKHRIESKSERDAHSKIRNCLNNLDNRLLRCLENCLLHVEVVTPYCQLLRLPQQARNTLIG